MKRRTGQCEVCTRNEVELTEHHLIPKEEGGTHLQTAMLCKPCHKQIHNLYTNRELAVRLGTVKKLQNDEQLKKFIKFIRKQPSSARVKMRKSNEKKQRRK
ncbi:HNH endonuclease [Salipaludibacillus aurantiacus]|uniref:HNH endonuclease n=1 Tax=Salipaludibacillus aurantiacus TaxID=1601833 RepID=A0A1H9VYS7_9BACI|nr:HNH endonuclease [Salipaludibacillus aurantiacus]SES26547.1 HNH endonuclease [Salipaludibacillus aurantiacus]